MRGRNEEGNSIEIRIGYLANEIIQFEKNVKNADIYITANHQRPLHIKICFDAIIKKYHCHLNCFVHFHIPCAGIKLKCSRRINVKKTKTEMAEDKQEHIRRKSLVKYFNNGATDDTYIRKYFSILCFVCIRKIMQLYVFDIAGKIAMLQGLR